MKYTHGGVELIEKRLLKYVPKRMHSCITSLYEHGPHAYSISMEIDGVEYYGLADSVSELRYAANILCNVHRNYQV